MYIGFEQASAGAASVNAADVLTVPGNAHGASIQAETQNVRYTMDNSTVPTSTSGMLFLTTEGPKDFGVDDVKRMKFIQGSGGAGKLNIHYYAGRDV